MNITDLAITARAERALRSIGVETVRDMAACDWIVLAEQKECGKRTLANIAAAAMQLYRGDMLKEARRIDAYYGKRKQRG